MTSTRLSGIKTLFFLSLILITAPFYAGCGQDKLSSCEVNGFHLDTFTSIVAYDSDFYDKSDSFISRNKKAQERCASFLNECDDLLNHYESLLSKTREGSDVYNINHAAGSEVKIDDDTAFVLEKAIYYAELSGGVFDPTIGTVTELWDFQADSDKNLPSAPELSSALEHVDYRNINLEKKPDGYYVSLSDPEAMIDLGGIAKGFIADKIKEHFAKRGIKSGIINLGGNVLLVGNKPDGSSINVGIQKPFGGSAEAVKTLSLSDKSVVTSGIYDRYFEKDGRIYHHILDTKTGFPTTNDLLSATIVSESSLDGDALSTICMSLGTEKGMELIDSIPDTFVLFIKDDYEIVSSDGFPAD
ncbi:MAG: FAD:protein FMN transferase [Butyrivibrio sp.]|nr:FAD:protein FMN transferase [Butyrivibrio sp.]